MKSSVKFLALASVMAATFGIASPSSAAIVTWDLRVAGSPAKVVEIVNPSQVITLELWGQVVNNDNNHANDGVAGASVRFLSVEGIVPLLGNYSNATKDPFFTLGAVGSANAALDANPDNEWGTASGASNTGNFNPSAIGTKMGTGAGGGTTDIFLGTITWTGPAVLQSGATTSLTVGYFKNATSGAGNFNVTADGVATANQNADSNLGVSTGVQLFVAGVPIPEPASLGLMGAGALALLSRRRRK